MKSYSIILMTLISLLGGLLQSCEESEASAEMPISFLENKVCLSASNTICNSCGSLQDSFVVLDKTDEGYQLYTAPRLKSDRENSTVGFQRFHIGKTSFSYRPSGLVAENDGKGGVDLESAPAGSRFIIKKESKGILLISFEDCLNKFPIEVEGGNLLYRDMAQKVLVFHPTGGSHLACAMAPNSTITLECIIDNINEEAPDSKPVTARMQSGCPDQKWGAKRQKALGFPLHPSKIIGEPGTPSECQDCNVLQDGIELNEEAACSFAIASHSFLVDCDYNLVVLDAEDTPCFIYDLHSSWLRMELIGEFVLLHLPAEAMVEMPCCNG